MAALYLHNAIWSPEQPETALTPASHATNRKSPTNPPQRPPRRMRSLSRTTLRTVSPDGLHPTEPLLRGNGTSESIAYRDLLSRQPPHPYGPQAVWDVGLSFEGDPLTAQERKVYREQTLRRRMRWYRLGKGTLEIVFCVWTVYTVVRYFIAYSVYVSRRGQVAALALGTSSTLALAFLMCTALISVFRQYLLLQHIFLDHILIAKIILQWLLSLFLLAPAFVNLVLTFAWSNSSDPDLHFKTRCHLDLDVVWSIGTDSCNHPSRLGPWIALSLIRFLMTLADLILYHIISHAYYSLRRPSWSRGFPNLSLGKAGRSRESFRISSPFQQLSSCQTVTPFVSSSSTLPRYPQTTVSTRYTGDRHSLGSNHSIHHSRSSGSRTLTNNSPSSSTDKELPPTPEYDIYANFDPSNPFGSDEWDEPQPKSTVAHTNEFKGFVDQFKSIVAQVARDTQQGMMLSRSSSISLPSTPSTPSSSSTVMSAGSYVMANLRTPSRYYNAARGSSGGGGDEVLFNPYDGYGGSPASGRVRMLGQYVRRMPTIESLGSREVGTSVGGSSVVHYQGEPGSLGSGTVSPQRTSVYSTMSSESSTGLSAYHTNVGHSPLVLLERDEGGSFHTAVSSSMPSTSMEPPPVPPKEPVYVEEMVEGNANRWMARCPLVDQGFLQIDKARYRLLLTVSVITARRYGEIVLVSACAGYPFKKHEAGKGQRHSGPPRGSCMWDLLRHEDVMKYAARTYFNKTSD